MISLELVGTSETLELKPFILQTENWDPITMKTNFYQDLGGGEKDPLFFTILITVPSLQNFPYICYTAFCPQLGSLGEWK